jgi:ABC-2 type transport system permease protein
MSSPIADLSYRNYDGPLAKPGRAWWVIAKNMIRIALQKKAISVVMGLSAGYYLVMIIVLFFAQQVLSSNPEGDTMMKAFLERVVWKDQFLHGFSYAQLPLLVVSLMLGAGTIANDNRANAMLVYLSKPVTRVEYLFGKWLGIALPLLLVMAVPTLLFYGYGAASFREYGFLEDPWILPNMLCLLPLAAAFHASLVLGISSLFNQGQTAAATYSTLYFLTYFFTTFMGVSWVQSRGEAPSIVKYLYYASIDGVLIGICKALLNTSGTPPIFFQTQNTVQPIPPPQLWAMAGIALAIALLFLFVAWRRVRAVEVV